MYINFIILDSNNQFIYNVVVISPKLNGKITYLILLIMPFNQYYYVLLDSTFIMNFWNGISKKINNIGFESIAKWFRDYLLLSFDIKEFRTDKNEKQ